MSPEFVVLFTTTVLLASIIPGPSMILALNHGIKYGAKRVIASAFGNLTATLLQATLSVVGLGAVLLQSQNLFNIIKYLGALYLIYIGIRTSFSTADFALEVDLGRSRHSTFRKLFVEAFLVTIGNPQAVIFFAALFPVFINTQKNSILQFGIIIIILSVSAFSCMMLYGFFGEILIYLFQRTRIARVVNLAVGSILIGIGISLISGIIN